MKLSISNIAWDKSQDEAVLSMLKKKGFSGLEIAPTRLIPQYPYDNIELGKQYALKLQKNYGLGISSMQSIWFGKKENLFHSQEDINELMEYTKKAIVFAKEIKCPNLVFGCPQNRNIQNEEDFRSINNIFDFFLEIGKFAQTNNTCFSIEPNPTIYNTNFINTTKEAFDIVKRINSPGLQVNVDVGTLIVNDEGLDELDFDYINHIHISEPNLKKIRKRELHKELFKRAKEYNYEKYISIEMGKINDLGQIREVLDYIIEMRKK